MFFRLVVGFLLAVSATSVLARDAGKGASPAGIYYAVPRNVLAPDRWRDGLHHTYDCRKPCFVAFDDRMSGVFLRYKWMQLNPARDRFDFSDLGAVIDDVRAAGKSVSLVIMAGKYTPSWVFDEGAARLSLPARTGDRFSQPFVPAPWDPVFIEAYARMIDALAEFLRQDPARYRTVVLVKNGAVVIHSAETRLMPVRPFAGKAVRDDPAALDGFRRSLCRQWAAIGYREDRILRAMARLNDRISTAFPDQYLGLAFVAGSARFPTVDETGKCTCPDRNTTMNKIIRQMVHRFGARAIINSTVLTADKGDPPINRWIVENGGLIGFQVNRQKVGCPEGAGAGCTERSFVDTLISGIDAGAVFIEVHDGDINRYRGILVSMNRRLIGNFSRNLPHVATTPPVPIAPAGRMGSPHSVEAPYGDW